jgi:predicted nucleic acid-binding Zn ribbon protein
MTIDTHRTRVCTVCARDFTTPAGNARVCSETCRNSDAWREHKRAVQRKAAKRSYWRKAK